MPLREVLKYENLAMMQGVSEVARGANGFLTAFKKVKGRYNDLSDHWKQKREGFISRHMAQMEKEPWYNSKGQPTRRHLALIMWAYSPDY